MPTRKFWSGKRRRSGGAEKISGKEDSLAPLRQARGSLRILAGCCRKIAEADPSTRCARSGFRQEAPARPASRSRLLAPQYKTGAYSPPRFSAPVLKGLPKPGDPGRSSTFGQLVCKAKAGVQKQG